MSDSGMPQPPPSGFKAGLPFFPPGKEDGQTARIERATGALQLLSRPVRVEGEITGVNRDGTVRIRTEHGDLDIRLRAREGQPLPPPGTRVEVDIAAGRPPRQAVIRPAPPETSGQQQVQPETPPELPVRPVQPRPSQGTEAPPPRPETDVVTTSTLPPLPLPPVRLPQEELPPLDAAAIQKPLNVGDVVRLLPLPPGAVYQAGPPVQDIESAVVTVVAAPVNLLATRIVEDTVDQQVEILIRLQALPVYETAAPVPPEDNVSSPVRQQAAAPQTLISAPEFFIAPLPVQPLETAFPPVLPSAQKNLPVQVLVLAEDPPVLVPPVLFLSVKPFLPSQTVPVAAEKVPSAPLPVQAVQETVLPVFRLLPLVAGNAVSPSSTALPHIPPFPAATLPPAPSLHHFPVRLPDVGNALPAIKPALFVQGEKVASGPDIPQAVISAKPMALDIAVVSLPPPAVRIVPTAEQQTPVPETPIAFLPDANPFLTKTAAVTALPVLPQAQSQDFVAAEKIVHWKNPAAAAAIVIGRTAQNLPVLSVKMPGFSFPQNFVLQLNAANLPAGTALEFVPQPGMMTAYHAPFPASAAADGMPPLSTSLQLFGGAVWPVMEELQQILQQRQEGLPAFEALARYAPNPANPARMPAAALFFLAAVRAGDFAGWLGDKTTEIIRRAGRADIIARAGRDFAGLQRSTAEPVAQEWRAMALPLVWQNDLHKMMLYYRRGGKDDDSSDPASFGTRFIFDLNLSRLGTVQLDGLHRQGQKRLDLIVRTQAPVGQNMRQAMRQAWIQTLERAHMNGEISFQHKPEQFVRIPLSDAGRAGITA